MRKALLAFAVMAIAVGGGGAALAQTDTVNEQDKTFLKAQQETNLAEVSLGKIVMERATSEKVRELATKLVSDHQQVLELNRTLTSKLGLALPEQPSAEQQATAEKIKKLSGAAFDGAYVAAQVEGHTKSVAAAQKEISSGSHPEVKAFATEYLPKAQMHLQHTQATQAELATPNLMDAAAPPNLVETAGDVPALARTGTGSGPLAAIGLVLASFGLITRRLGRRRHQN
jgi:putative membrane protein